MSMNPLHSNFRLTALAMIVAGVAQFARADQIPYAPIGTPNPESYTFTATNSGDVTAYFAGSSAGYTEYLGVEINVGFSPGRVMRFPTTVPRLVTRSITARQRAGDTLTFVIDAVTTVGGFVSSDPSQNVSYDSSGTDGRYHVYATPYTGNGVGSPVYPGVPAGTSLLPSRTWSYPELGFRLQ